MGAAALLVTGAQTSDRAMTEAMVVREIPSLKAWALVAPQEYRRLVAAESAGRRAGVPAAQRRAVRERAFHMAASAKLSHADDAILLRHLELTHEAGMALAKRSPQLCVELYEHGAGGAVERALPADLRRAWLREQAALMRVPYGARPALASPDEEVAAFSRASDIAAQRLGIGSDEFMSRMMGRADPAAVCAAHNALSEALREGGRPAAVARIYRRHASQVGDF